MIHTLKTIQPYYDDVDSGKKTFEVRTNDRDFKVGDELNLTEYPDTGRGKRIYLLITYVLDNPLFVKKGYVILGFKRMYVPY
jgi:hypothetical protein